MDLTNEQWARVATYIPAEELDPTPKRGRPWQPARAVLNGVLWILRTGAQWEDLPERYPPHSTCHRRFQKWVRLGVMEQLLQGLARDLYERGGIDVSECFIDGTFVGAKKGAQRWERPSAAKVRNSWQWQTVLVFLSPYAQQVLARMKSPSSPQPSPPVSPPRRPSA
jgi:transposase